MSAKRLRGTACIKKASASLEGRGCSLLLGARGVYGEGSREEQLGAAEPPPAEFLYSLSGRKLPSIFLRLLNRVRQPLVCSSFRYPRRVTVGLPTPHDGLLHQSAAGVGWGRLCLELKEFFKTSWKSLIFPWWESPFRGWHCCPTYLYHQIVFLFFSPSSSSSHPSNVSWVEQISQEHFKKE